MKMKLLVLLFLLWQTSFIFASSKIEKYAYQAASDFLQNPKMLFLDIQYNIEDTTPAWIKNSAIQTNVFMNVMGVANLNIKREFLAQDGNVPQITAGIGGWYFWGLNLLKEIDSLEKARNLNVYGFVPFVTASMPFTDDLDLFAGTKLSIGHVEMDFSQVVQEEISDPTLRNMVKNISYINETYVDPSVYIGIGIKTSDVSRISALVGYQLIEQRVYAKVIWVKEWWEFGIGFYPDSVLIIHPIINFSVKFDL